MPTSEVPTNVNEPRPNDGPPEAEPKPSDQDPSTEPESGGPGRLRGSRWVDYDTHELLEMISELEDERRWARLREGIWIAILVHALLISGLTWIPKYVFRVPPVIDPIDAIKQRKDLTYLDLPPDALRQIQPKVTIKPVPLKPHVDSKTLEDLRKSTPPPAPEPAPQVQQQASIPSPVQPAPQPAPLTPQPSLESPHPSAVPARPNFAMGSANPADQLRDAMKGSARQQGSQGSAVPLSGLARHPGASTGGLEILSDTQGVDFRSWLQRWYQETRATWDPLIPEEVNPPILKSGQVMIRFKVGSNGRVVDGSMQLEARSGDTALDRAAWGAITGSNYPPLPRDFHGPYIELRALFTYNMQQ